VEVKMEQLNRLPALGGALGLVAALVTGQASAQDIEQPGLRIEAESPASTKLALGDKVQSFWNGLDGRFLPGGWSARFDAQSSRGSSVTTAADLAWGEGLNLQRAALGNIYFSRFAGLRATGGMLGLSRATAGRLAPSAGTAAPVSLDRPGTTTGFEGPAPVLPYIGLGYSSHWLSGPTSASSSWGLSADLGLLAASPRSAVRLGQQGLDDTLRELRVAPMLQLGVTYTF
jgi:hypothetical protein